MRIQIAHRQCDVPEPVIERVHEQLPKLSKYHPRITAADVVFKEEKLSHEVEVILHIDGSAPVVAHASDREFLSALDRTVDRLAKILRRERGKRTDHQAPKLSEMAGEPSAAD